MEIDWILVTVALTVGLLVGLTGVGGGAIMTPVLVGFFSVPLPVAIATDLIFATVTKLIGIGPHHRGGAINWKLAGRLWTGSIPGTVFGVVIVLLVVQGSHADWLTWPLAALVLMTAVVLARRALLKKSAVAGRGSTAQWSSKSATSTRLAPVGGFGIGTAVAITSVGAGALGMALLVKVSPPNIRPQELVGTDLVHAIPIAMIAGAAYWTTGLVSIPLLFTLLAGSIPGVIIGSLLSDRAPARFLNGLLAVVLTASVIALVMK